MEIDRHKLPEDVAALRQMVVGLLEEVGSNSCNTCWNRCCVGATARSASG